MTDPGEEHLQRQIPPLARAAARVFPGELASAAGRGEPLPNVALASCVECDLGGPRSLGDNNSDCEGQSRRAMSGVDFQDGEWGPRAFALGIWNDAQGIVTPRNSLILGVSLAVAIGLRQDLDGEVREETAAHPQRWGEAGHVLGKLGEAPVQVPLLALLWGTSVWTDDAALLDFTRTLTRAYTINGLATLAIKGITNTRRPDPDWNGGQWGFPSFHAASAFTIAAVLEEYYGWGAGAPAYALAGLIGWSRIDERDHDLSDVVFGAAMGWVIGKSVAGRHLRGDGRVQLRPWADTRGAATGIALETRF